MRCARAVRKCPHIPPAHGIPPPPRGVEQSGLTVHGGGIQSVRADLDPPGALNPRSRIRANVCGLPASRRSTEGGAGP